MIDLTPKRTKTGSPQPFHVLVDLDSLYSWYKLVHVDLASRFDRPGNTLLRICTGARRR